MSVPIGAIKGQGKFSRLSPTDSADKALLKSLRQASAPVPKGMPQRDRAVLKSAGLHPGRYNYNQASTRGPALTKNKLAGNTAASPQRLKGTPARGRRTTDTEKHSYDSVGFPRKSNTGNTRG